MDIRSALKEKFVVFLKGRTKREVLHEMAEVMAGSAEIRDAARLEEAVLSREELMSTGIGLGIAVPHVRLDEVTAPVMAVGISPQGVPDYDSLDGQTVHVVVMIAAGIRQHALYIRLLAAVTALLRRVEVREALLKARTPAEAYNLLCVRSSVAG